MRVFLCSIFLGILLPQSFSQVVQGIIVDLQNEPIPFAHIRMDGKMKGTLSNIEGRFLLRLDQDVNSITISSIGYKSKQIVIADDQELTVLLEEDILRLQEVTIVSKDYAKELIEKAQKSIGKNYPTTEELISGFIRETLSKDSLGTDIHYISEAQTEASKASYERRSVRDEVKLIKGRKLLVNTDSLSLRIYAGAHLPHRFDMVIRREGPMNSSAIDSYEYEITDTLNYLNKPLYQVSYRAMKNTESGFIYVLDSSYAVVKTVQRFEKKHFSLASVLKSNERQFLQATTDYSFHEDLIWRLNFVRYETAFLTGKERKVYLNSQYTAHEFNAEEEKIPYNDRLQFGEFLLEEVNNYDSAYWDGYSVTIPSSQNQKAFEELSSMNNPADQPKVLNLIDVLIFSYGIQAIESHTSIHSISYMANAIELDRTVPGSSKYSFAISSMFGLKLSDTWRFEYNSARSIGKVKYEEWRLGISYFKPFSNTSRFSINPAVQFGKIRHGMLVESVVSNETFKISGKKFDAETIDVFTQSRLSSIIPSFAFVFEKSSSLSLALRVSKYLTLNEKNGIHLVEDQNFIKRKNAFISSDEDSLSIESPQGTTFQSGLSLGLSVLFGL